MVSAMLLLFCSGFGSSAGLYFDVLILADAPVQVGPPVLSLCSCVGQRGELPGQAVWVPLPTHRVFQAWAAGHLSLSHFWF